MNKADEWMNSVLVARSKSLKFYAGPFGSTKSVSERNFRRYIFNFSSLYMMIMLGCLWSATPLTFNELSEMRTKTLYIISFFVINLTWSIIATCFFNSATIDADHNFPEQIVFQDVSKAHHI